MKQAVVALAVIMVVLLVVSGVIVAGSLQQSELLVSRANQVNELNTRLRKLTAEKQELEVRAEEAEEALMTAKAERDEIALQMKDTVLALETANGVVAQKEAEQAAARTTFAGETGDLRTQLTEKEQAYEQLMGKVNSLTLDKETWLADKQTYQQENDALTKAKANAAAALEAAEAESNGLKKELQAMITDAKAQSEKFSQLNDELKAFASLMEVWRTALIDGEAKPYEQAAAAFERVYPKSVLTPPELALAELTAADAEGNTAGSTGNSADRASAIAPTGTPVPTAAPQPAASPLASSAPTFAPLTTTAIER